MLMSPDDGKKKTFIKVDVEIEEADFEGSFHGGVLGSERSVTQTGKEQKAKKLTRIRPQTANITLKSRPYRATSSQEASQERAIFSAMGTKNLNEPSESEAVIEVGT